MLQPGLSAFEEDYYQDLPGLISLVDAQRNLKNLSLYNYDIKEKTYEVCEGLSETLARKGNTIKRLRLSLTKNDKLSFLPSFINLKKLKIKNL